MTPTIQQLYIATDCMFAAFFIWNIALTIFIIRLYKKDGGRVETNGKKKESRAKK